MPDVTVQWSNDSNGSPSATETGVCRRRGRYGISRRAPLLALAAASVVLLAACHRDDGLTGPTPTTPSDQSNRGVCGDGSTLALEPLQGITLDCSSGTTIQLASQAATYIVTPQLATDTGSVRPPVPYSLAASGAGLAASVSASVRPSADAVPAGRAFGHLPSPLPGKTQRAFDAALRSYARRAVARGTWRRGPAPSASMSRATARAVVPPLNSLRSFQVVSSFDVNARFTTVTARLEYLGGSVMIYVDTLSPAPGFTSDQLAALGTLLDQTLYPIDTAAFGNPSDIDQNGHVIMLLTPVVNALTAPGVCSTAGFVAGFFDGVDLVTVSNSNQGEIMYGIVPDPGGTVSCSHSVADVDAALPPIFLHELQHLISFSQHVVIHGGDSEQGWLDEGLSIVAEELGALHYEQKFPPPAGRTDPAQIFPDSAETFAANFLGDSYDYLLRPDTTTVTLHSDADDGLAWRGGDWLLMRWLGDHEAAGFYRRLEQSPFTGGVNIAQTAGESFQSLFGDFAIAMYADSVPGASRASIPSRYRFQTRTLRALYARLFATSGGGIDVPRVFPILPTPLTGTVVSSMPQGTVSYYVLTTTGGGPVTLSFAAPGGGGTLGTRLHPQVGVFRVQ